MNNDIEKRERKKKKKTNKQARPGLALLTTAVEASINHALFAGLKQVGQLACRQQLRPFVYSRGRAQRECLRVWCSGILTALLALAKLYFIVKVLSPPPLGGAPMARRKVGFMRRTQDVQAQEWSVFEDLRVHAPIYSHLQMFLSFSSSLSYSE